MTAAAPSPPSGIICPIATPLTAAGDLREDVFRELIEALLPDLDGVFVLGSSGELTGLRAEVARRTVEVAVDQVAGRIPVLAGVGDTGLARTLARADWLAIPGVSQLVVAAPFYYQVPTEAAIVDHYVAVVKRSALPVVLYNIPQSTHQPLTAGIVRELAAHPRIVGIKDSSGDWFAFQRFLALRSEGFSVLQGREQLAAASYWGGADGLVSGMSNLAPRLLRALQTAIRDDRPRAEGLALEAAIEELARVFTVGDWLAGLKGTLEALGWAVGDPSPPMPPAEPRHRAEIERILATTDDGWLTRRPSE
jgi:dihydrodipicolinate synthase/N-acetylneuraminate lyase